MTMGNEQRTAGSEQVTIGSGQRTAGSGQVTMGSGQMTAGSGQVTMGNEQMTAGSEQVTMGSEQVTMGSEQKIRCQANFSLHAYVLVYGQTQRSAPTTTICKGCRKGCREQACLFRGVSRD